MLRIPTRGSKSRDTDRVWMCEPSGELPRAILIVDDEEMIRTMLGRFLDQEGLPYWLAKSGAEAVEIYRQHAAEIAMVLLDVRMPGLDGPHTFTLLRSINPELVCHFMSGNTAPYTERDLIRMGAASLIPKPLAFRVLTEIVQHCLANT